MKRKELLKFLKGQLVNLGAPFPILEVYLPPGFGNISVLRTLLISDAPPIADVINFFGRFTAGTMQTSWFARYTDAEDILSSQLISENSAEIELNWRGRLWKWTDISNIRSQPEFVEKIFASYWRLLVTHREPEYFVRHEISPSYINPGHSTPGFPEFKEQIVNFLDFLVAKNKIGKIDPEFDRIVIFVRREPSKTFIRSNPIFFNQQTYISFNDLVAQIQLHGKAAIVDQIHTAIIQTLG